MSGAWVPKPKAHQVLLEIKAGGFYHTDCMALENAFNSKLPFICSHEPAGVVVDVGTEVDGLLPEDRVGYINFEGRYGESHHGKGPLCPVRGVRHI